MREYTLRFRAGLVSVAEGLGLLNPGNLAQAGFSGPSSKSVYRKEGKLVSRRSFGVDGWIRADRKPEGLEPLG